jgi:hypothetical protein
MTIKKREEATLKQRAALVLVISFVGAILMITSSLVPLPTSDDYRYVPPAAGAAASLRRISSGDKAAREVIWCKCLLRGDLRFGDPSGSETCFAGSAEK